MKSKYPFVSITILTHNCEQTIKKCLSSVFNADYPKDRYEVIIVDSGSNDRTLEIVKDFPIDKIIVKEGISRGHARNIGMQEAKGEIVAMVDSDHEQSSRDWLTTIVREFNDPRVALVRVPDCIPLPSQGEAISLVKRIIFFSSIRQERLKED